MRRRIRLWVPCGGSADEMKGARHQNEPDSWLHRTRGCTGPTAMCTRSHSHVPPSTHSLATCRRARGPWSVATHLHTAPPSHRPTFTPPPGRTGARDVSTAVHIRHGPGSLGASSPHLLHRRADRRSRVLPVPLPIQPTSASIFYHPLYFSPFEPREERIPSLLCLPAVSIQPIQSDSMTETGDTAVAVADTAVTTVDRVKRPTRPDDTETKHLIEDLQSTST